LELDKLTRVTTLCGLLQGEGLAQTVCILINGSLEWDISEC